MIGPDEVTAAFLSLAPEMMGGDPEAVIRNRGVDPEAVAGTGNQLTRMFAMQNTSPEEAVPAAFSIGVLLGLELTRASA